MLERSSRILHAAWACLLVSASLVGGHSSYASAQTPIAGMVRQTEIRVSGMITGRLASITVQPGQRVTRGDLLAVLDNPELAASVEEARAAVASARAERERVYAGVRAEEISIAEQALQNVEANLRLAEQMSQRAAALVARNAATRARLDESTATLSKAQADLTVKQSQLEAARAGASADERKLADAKLALATATLADLNARFDKTRLLAPVDGTIGMRVAEPGEILPQGKPILTIVADTSKWFGFTLREDALRGLAMGQVVALSRPDGQKIQARVTEIRPLGEFATWRASRAVGDHDLNSFRLRLEPVDTNLALESGMTVWLHHAQ